MVGAAVLDQIARITCLLVHSDIQAQYQGKTDMTSRRDILSMLGLSAGALAISTDAIAEHRMDHPGLPPLMASNNFGDPQKQQDKFAEALETLAKNVRSGQVNVVSLCTTSDMKPDEWLQHNIKLTLEIPCEPPKS